MKCYELISKINDLGLTIVVNGDPRRIRFKGGDHTIINGRYFTKDQDEIKALEESNLFGKLYREQKVSRIIGKPQPEIALKEVVKTEAPIITNTDPNDPASKKYFSTVKEAREYLIAEYGATIRQVRNYDEVRAFGSTKGLDIEIVKD